MSVARWIASAAVVAAAVAGSMLDTATAVPPLMAGGYHVVAADFHVHAFPGDGALPRWELAREASRRGLHALVVSNHNQTLAPKILPGLFTRSAFVIPSQEVTSRRFHLVAVGVTRTIDWRLPELEIARQVHAQGGVVIAAHPVGNYWKVSDDMLAALDGAEVAHPLTTMLATGRDELSAFFSRTRTLNATAAPIGSSDFHMVAPLASNRTYVFAESVTQSGILDAIRAGRTVAQDQDGVFYGDPGLTTLLAQSGALTTPPPARPMVSLSVLIALMAMLAIVLLR